MPILNDTRNTSENTYPSLLVRNRDDARGVQHVEAAAGEQALAGTDQRSRGAAEGGEPARVLTITILSACRLNLYDRN